MKLKKGANQLVLQLSGRGKMRIQFEEPESSLFVGANDPTLPDLRVGIATEVWGAVVVVNAFDRPADGLALTTSGPGLEPTTTLIPEIPPLSIHKAAFRIRGGFPANDTKTVPLTVALGRDNARLHDRIFELRVRAPDENQRRTFRSRIDDSVQYFGIREADTENEEERPALVLSCHGASVKGERQSSSYPTKRWLHLVAPTNRRPFGFDWEDFGRADALEVLDIAKQTLRHDPSRVYLTGHSMGGHGTWHIGSTFPDLFAAIGPSAGWISYDSYGRRRGATSERTPLEKLLRRGRLAGNPLELKDNLKHHGIYILHGADDDNVPVSQARRMAEALGDFHNDWQIHEEPGKRHWWSNDFKDGGATCMDWPHMYDMFARHALPPAGSLRKVEFATANPGVSSDCRWLSIEAQKTLHAISKASIMTWPNQRRFEGTTENVARLRLQTSHLRNEGPIALKLDDQSLEVLPANESILLERVDGNWTLANKVDASHKGPHRYGAIKNELRNRFLFVYGTQGNPEEQKWMFAKARLDAETFWYRGNASPQIVSDTDYAADPEKFADRTVVLYGNSDTNAAWNELLGTCPVQVTTDRITIGSQVLTGDYGTCFVRPSPHSDNVSVIVIAGTNPRGMRICNPFSLFVPFVRYPDLVVIGSEDNDRFDIVHAGYFGLDWSIENGEFSGQASP